MSFPASSLASLSSLITKGTTPTTLGYVHTDSGIPFLRVQNIFGGQVKFDEDTLFIDSATHIALKRSQIQGGDVLVTIAGTIGRTGVVPFDAPEMNCNQAVAIVRTTGQIENNYLRHWLESRDARTQMLGSVVTGTISNLSLSQLGQLRVPLPSLKEQRRIAAILDKAEALRVKRREALAQLDRLAQSIFIEMFGDPFDSNLSWTCRPLSACCEAINDCPHSTPTWSDSGYVCLRTSNLTVGDWDWQDKRFVSENEYKERSKRGYIKSGDIVLSREGTIGVAAIVEPEMKVCMGQRLVQIRCTEDLIVPEFLLYHLLNVLQPSRISRLMVGSTAQHLNVKELRGLPTPLPPLALQELFARRIKSIKTLKSSQRESKKSADALFDSLQHRAFQGAL